MICINCFHDKTNIVNSRGHKKHPSTWRRHRCPQCQTTFTTYEQPTLDGSYVLGRDGQQRPFNLGKLIISIAHSFQHDTDEGASASLALAQTVQEKLLIQHREISSEDIMAVTHHTLECYDPVAAMQYAAQHDLITTKRRRGRPSTSYERPYSGH